MLGGSSEAGVKPQCQVCQKYHFRLCRHKGKPRCGKCNRFGHITKDCDSHSHKQLANYAEEEEVTTGTMFYTVILQVCKIKMYGLWTVLIATI